MTGLANQPMYGGAARFDPTLMRQFIAQAVSEAAVKRGVADAATGLPDLVTMGAGLVRLAGPDFRGTRKQRMADTNWMPVNDMAQQALTDAGVPQTEGAGGLVGRLGFGMLAPGAVLRAGGLVNKGLRAADDALGLARSMPDEAGALRLGSALTPEQIAAMTPKTTPRLGKVSGAEIGDTKLRVPVGELQADVTDFPMSSLPTASVEDMSGVLIPLPGDRTAAGGIVNAIQGQNLISPYELHGGMAYPRLPGVQADQAVWASEPSAATRFVSNVNKNAERGPVWASYLPMGARSDNSSVMMTEGITEMLKLNPVGRKAAKEIDAQLETIAMGIPSVRKPDDLKRFLLGPGQLSTRGRVAEVLGMGKSQELGAPDLAAIRFANTDPQLMGLPTYQGSQFAVRFDAPTASTGPGVAYQHPGYSTQIKGGSPVGIAGAEGGIPIDVLFPKLTQDIAARGITGSKAQRTFNVPGAQTYQVIDNEWKDTVQRFLERMKQDPQFAAGGKR